MRVYETRLGQKWTEWVNKNPKQSEHACGGGRNKIENHFQSTYLSLRQSISILNRELDIFQRLVEVSFQMMYLCPVVVGRPVGRGLLDTRGENTNRSTQKQRRKKKAGVSTSDIWREEKSNTRKSQ